MSKSFVKPHIKNDIQSGLTGAMLLGSYALCTAASVGLGLWNVFFCVVICALFSLKEKNRIYSPDAFLILPLHYIISEYGTYCLPICVMGGILIYYLLSKTIKQRPFTKGVVAWATLALALVATIILTNLYFGIGASGSTAIEMLKSYRSLGFHPHFRGLLYGTITLFAMITYPFKFRTLNKTLPAEFMTLLIPLILNLILNPQKELTTINEIASFEHNKYILPFSSAESFDTTNILPIIIGAVFWGFVLFLRSTPESNEKNSLVNLTSGVLSFLPVRKLEITRYSSVSAFVTIAVCGLVIILCPDILARIPMHCIGALLIVSVWQQIPYKNLSLLFKKADKGVKE